MKLNVALGRSLANTVLPLLAALVALPACSSSESSSSDGEEILEIYSWLTNPGEADALAAVLSMHKAEHPNVKVINALVADSANANDQLRKRMIEASPPDAFQNMGGLNLLQWVIYNGHDDSESKIEPIDFLAPSGGWASVLPKGILDSVSYGSQTYSVPMGVHRYNVLFYNKKLFEEYDIAVPSSLEEFYRAGDAFKAKGIVPLALGSKDGWPLTLIAFDGVLIAQAGPSFRGSYLTGGEAADDARVTTALKETVHILDYTNTDHDAMSWDQAAEMVVNGTAAMTMMGDWAKGFLVSQGLRPGIELGQIPIPGTAGTFVHLIDSFGLPKGAHNRQGATDFLSLLGSTRAQDVFNPIKGATPPRIDADLSLYDPLAQKNIQDLKTDVLASWDATNVEFTAELDAAMKQLGVDGKVESVQGMLKNRYDRLKK